MKTNAEKSNPKVWLGLLFSLALAILFGSPETVVAQWSTAANGNDIYKTNTTGNVGIGATAFDAWDTNFKVIGLNNNSGFTIAAANTSGWALHLTDRAYFDGTNWKYSVSSFPVANYYQGSGLHGFRVAPAGTAGNNVTWTNALFINNSGNVGIGTTSPSAKLEVDGSGIIRVTEGSREVLPSSGAGLELSANSSGSYVGAYNRSGTPSYRPLNFYGSNYYFESGNVGIGTPTPGAKLEVSGNISVIGAGAGNINAAGTITGGNIVAKYQDVAEWVLTSEQIPAGTVVVLDCTKSNQVISSSQAYDTRVAGVISERPGIALGENGNNKVLVATTGRVRVKVDASRAPIHIGDLLVTSDVPGVAMKSEPVNLGGVQLHRPGTLIGKALEPLAKGQGEILVLLSLQ